MAEKDERTCETTEACKPAMPMDSLTEFSNKIVSLLVAEAMEALKAPTNAGLAFAAELIDDAMKYDIIYPRVRGTGDDSMILAANKIRNWNAVRNGMESQNTSCTMREPHSGSMTYQGSWSESSTTH